MLGRTRGLPPAPHAERRPKTSRWHGITLTDDYAWLRADNWREVMRDPSVLDPKIREYLEAENAYTKAAVAHTEALQETLFAEMKGRIKEDDSTVPSPDGPYAYYVRYREGGQHPIMCRQPRDGGSVQELLDGDALAAGKAYFQLGGSDHSPDHKLLAWSADDKGSEYDTLHVREISSGRDLPDEIPDVEGSVVWSTDSTAVYYVRLDANHRPSRVYRHRLGTLPVDDVLVYEEQDIRYFVSLGELQSGRYAVISVHDHETSECWLVDLAVPDAKPRLVAPRETSVQYDVDHHPNWHGQETLVIRTNSRRPRTSRSCSRRSPIRLARTGAISSHTGAASSCSARSCFPSGSSGSNARTRSRASWCGISQAKRSTRSPFPRKRIRSALTTARNS